MILIVIVIVMVVSIMTVQGAYRLFAPCGRCTAHRRKALVTLVTDMYHTPTGCWKIRTANREVLFYSGLPSFPSIMTVPVIPTHSSEGLLHVTHANGNSFAFACSP